MAPRGSQTKDLAKKNRLKRISRIKAQIAQLEKQGGTGKGSFRTRTKISQLKKTLRDIGGGYQKTKTYNTKKVEVDTSRGLKIRNVAVKPKKKYNDGKMSNIPVGEGYVNNPNYGKKPEKIKSNPSSESSSNNGNSDNKSSNQNKTDNKNNKDNKDNKVVEKKEVKKDPLAKYRRTKGEGVGKGDTRITKKLKKSGFTETRLAKLREKNAAFQKAKKGGKAAMKKYREKYPKRG